MEEKEMFEYTYSAPEQRELEMIREKYLPKKMSKMECLRKLDESTTKRASMVAVTHGIVSCLILGLGMSCCMVWQGDMMIPGIVVGTAGIGGIVATYPIYQRVAEKCRKDIASEIIRLSDEIMGRCELAVMEE